MRRVVPSQVVSVINNLFPNLAHQADKPGQEITLDSTYSYRLAAVTDLVDQIPYELITITDTEYMRYLASIAAIKMALEIWKTRGNASFSGLQSLSGLSCLNPVTIVRQSLEKCPDEFPVVSTAELAFITDVDLRNSIRLDISAAELSFRNTEWKSTTVLAGSAMEALLLWRLNQEDPHDLKKRVINGTDVHKMEHWDLHTLLVTAKSIGVIQESTYMEADLARDFRNLIHPGRSKRLGLKCNRATALTALAALEHILNDLNL